MFVTLTLPSYGRVRARRDARRSVDATTTGEPRWTRCTSPSWSTGSGRTCAARPATRCSTSRRWRPSAGSHHICTPRSAARSPGQCSGRSRRRPTTRSGGRRTTSPVRRADAAGVGGRASGTSTRRRGRRCRPGPRRWTALDDDPDAEPAHALRLGPAARHAGDHRHRGRRGPAGGVPDEVPDQELRRGDAATTDDLTRRQRMHLRPAARGGPVPALLAAVLELAAVRHPAPGG